MRLAVLIGGQIAGDLDLGDGRHAFLYDSAYRRRADVPLSVQFPLATLGADGERLDNWLHGLLPDDPAIIGALCAEGGLARSESLRLLGEPMGADCAGAVQFCPHESAEALRGDTGGQEPIDDAGIADWLVRMETDPTRRAYRTDGTDSGFSIAGIQPKVALRRTDSGWTVPRGALPTTHLIKASRDHRWPHEAIIEHLTMRTAAGCGIPAARTEVRRCAGREVIIVERFDRTVGGAARVHQEDMCQALGLPPQLKYQRDGGPSPEDIAGLLRTADPDRADDNIARLLDSLLYQWITASTDGHAKNLGILHPGDGTVRLSPLYDVCSWLPYRKGTFVKKIQLAMKIGTDYSLKTADTPDGLRRTAARLGIDPARAARRAVEIAHAVPDALDTAIRALPAEFAALDEVEALRREQADRAERCRNIAAG